MINSVILDDEYLASKVLGNLLKEHCPFVNIVGIANSVPKAYEIIQKEKPALLFLDVMMPREDGFSLLKRFDKIPFDVIFTTSYQDYAFDAFKYSAVDYILKPIEPNELKKAVGKITDKYIGNAGQKNASIERLIVQTNGGAYFINPTDVIRLESTNQKIFFHMKDNSKFHVYKNLNDYEDIFQKFNFFRTHRSHLINLWEIQEYVSDKNGGCIIMTGRKMVPLSINRRAEFLNKFIGI